MIQLNLLPDVKLEYIKAQRARRLVLTICILATAVSVLILLLLLSADALQKKHLKDLSKDITSESSKLQNEPNINEILTVQNQLESLTTLHSDEPAAPRLFDYLNSVTPANISITDMKIDFTAQTISITGNSDSLSNVNKYVDTLKFTSYTSGNSTDASPAFSNIVLSSFSLNTDTQDPSQAANYTITASYDKNIFDVTQKIKLIVPSIVTTRSQLGQSTASTDLFKALPTPAPKGGQ